MDIDRPSVAIYWDFENIHATLIEQIELIQLFPPGAAAKNGADIKLCLDATEDMLRFPHVTTIVIIGADSDFLPVSQKIKAAGRTLVGVGVEAATNRHWAHSCHEFRYYERLVLVTAYDSLVNVAREYFRWLPVGLLMRDRYDSVSRASQVKAPAQMEVVVVPGVGHNTLDLSPEYLGAVREFLAATSAQSTRP